MIGQLATGVRDTMRGAGFLASRPRLWRWVLAPAALALAIIAAVIWALAEVTHPLVAWAVGLLPHFLHHVLGDLLTVLLVAVLAVAGYFVFLGVASMVSGPFCESLSEAIETELTGEESPPFRARQFVYELLVGMVHATRRTVVYFIAVGALSLVGILVPVIGPAVTIVGGAIASARFAAYDAFDAVWARKGMRYREKILYLRTHRGHTYGVGAVTALLAALPPFSLIALQVGCAGATLAYLDEHPTGPPPAPR